MYGNSDYYSDTSVELSAIEEMYQSMYTNESLQKLHKDHSIHYAKYVNKIQAYLEYCSQIFVSVFFNSIISSKLYCYTTETCVMKECRLHYQYVP